MSNQEYDWMFDCILAYMDSSEWDDAVMSFIDESCWQFEDKDENCLLYTEIHNNFKILVDSLLEEKLANFDVHGMDFLAACQKGKLNRDVNLSVLEKLLSIEDFLTFKRIMVKRNIQLDLEAIEALQKSMADLSHISPTESVETVTSSADSDAFIGDSAPLDDLEMLQAIAASLVEIELRTKQEDLEQSELDEALKLSMMEKDRLDSKLDDDDDDYDDDIIVDDRTDSKEIFMPQCASNETKYTPFNDLLHEEESAKQSQDITTTSTSSFSPSDFMPSPEPKITIKKKAKEFSSPVTLRRYDPLPSLVLKPTATPLVTTSQSLLEAATQSIEIQPTISDAEIKRREQKLLEQRSLILGRIKQERETRRNQAMADKADDDNDFEDRDAKKVVHDDSKETDSRRQEMRLALVDRLRHVMKDEDELNDDIQARSDKVERMRAVNKSKTDDVMKQVRLW